MSEDLEIWRDEEAWLGMDSGDRWLWFIANHAQFLQSLDAIRPRKFPATDFFGHPESGNSGVYFLFLGEDLIYIGKATIFSDRLEQHYRPDRPSLNTATWFDHISLVSTPNDFAERVEGYYIKEFKPPRNIKPGRPWKIPTR